MNRRSFSIYQDYISFLSLLILGMIGANEFKNTHEKRKKDQEHYILYIQGVRVTTRVKMTIIVP